MSKPASAYIGLAILLLLFAASPARSQEPFSATESDRTTAPADTAVVREPAGKAESDDAETGYPSETEKLRRFEIEGHYSNLQFGTFDPEATREFREIAPFPPGIPYHGLDKNPKDSGLGARFTYNVNRYLGLEVEANWFFQKNYITRRPLINQSPHPGGNKFQMLFGPKIGKRWKRFGVFGKVRLGFIHFNRYPVTTWIQQVPPGQPFFTRVSLRKAKFFNVDVGGVFEYYPSKRTILRFDIGDTIVHYNRQEPKEYNPTFNRHNLQINVGFGFRF